MKGQWKGFISGFVVATMVFGLGVPALAATVRQINASYSGIKITLDGNEVVPKDANGAVVEPFVVDGTTYLPVRAVANALGVGVEWDGATQTVKLMSGTTTTQETPKPTPTTGTPTLGQKNALKAAINYISIMPFSRTGLIRQLEFEGYSNSEAIYGADNCGADWNEQAAKKAQDYLDLMSFSRDGLIDQLEFEGFTAEQAKYGANAVGY